MGGAASALKLPDDIDDEAFKKIAGDHYSPELFNQLKDTRLGVIKRSDLVRELKKQTDVYLSHEWGTDELNRNNHDRVVNVKKWLETHGIISWLDEERITGSTNDQVNNGIDKTGLFLIFLTKAYLSSIAGKHGQGDINLKEFTYALNNKTSLNFIIIVQEPRCLDKKEWFGPAAELTDCVCIDNTSDDEAIFESNMQQLKARIIEKTTPLTMLPGYMLEGSPTTSGNAADDKPKALVVPDVAGFGHPEVGEKQEQSPVADPSPSNGTNSRRSSRSTNNAARRKSSKSIQLAGIKNEDLAECVPDESVSPPPPQNITKALSMAALSALDADAGDAEQAE